MSSATWDDWIKDKIVRVSTVGSRGGELNPSWVVSVLGELRVHEAQQNAFIDQLLEYIKKLEGK